MNRKMYHYIVAGLIVGIAGNVAAITMAAERGVPSVGNAVAVVVCAGAIVLVRVRWHTYWKDNDPGRE